MNNGGTSENRIRRVGILFSGGPAPAANAVICATALSFLDTGCEVIGFYEGYRHLLDRDTRTDALEEGRHYHRFTLEETPGLRTVPGVFIRTARANPGMYIKKPADLEDPEKAAPLQRVYEGVLSLGLDALVSIGGDDTLKTANFLVEYQKRLPAEAPRFKVVHVPKTIDNDYNGIDFTFGFFTAVDFLAEEVKNLRADAKASCAYFIAEVMGRKAGWISYGVGIAGKANMIFGVEDLDEESTIVEKVTDPSSGMQHEVRCLNLDALVGRIADLVIQREQKQNKRFGVIVLAEGLSEKLPPSYLEGVAKDEHGHISLGKLNIGNLVARLVSEEYARRTDEKLKATGIQLGYESRCARPHAYDVMLGCALGHGAYRILAERGLTGHMVSLKGQMDLDVVPFEHLVDPETLVTKVRFIEKNSDIYRLARFLEEKVKPSSAD